MEVQIKGFGMSRMSIGSCSNFHKKINALIDETTPEALHIVTQAPLYKAASITLASIVNRDKAFVATLSLAEADDCRDRAAGIIGQIINAHLTSPIEEKRAAARLLDAKMSPYRRLRNHEYTKETSEIEGMLAMLDRESEAVERLSLTEEVEYLREINTTFDQLYDEKAIEMSKRMEQSDIKSADAIEAANNLYLEIAQRVNAYVIVEPTDEIREFIKRVNGLVGSFSQIAESSTGGTPTPDPKPDKPITPAITAVYQVEGGNPDKPNEIKKGEKTRMEWVGGFELVNETGDGPGDIILRNDMGLDDTVRAESILERSNKYCEFIMTEDLTEGEYEIRIETYDGGKPLVVKYPEKIKLNM